MWGRIVNIRSRSTPFTTDYALLSREGWTVQLLQMWTRASFDQNVGPSIVTDEASSMRIGQILVQRSIC